MINYNDKSCVQNVQSIRDYVSPTYVKELHRGNWDVEQVP